MQIATAQQDMATAYVRGAPGVFISGLVWLIAGILWDRAGIVTAFAALFVGGMLIFPASVLVSRLVFRSPPVTPGNPLQSLALESTFGLFGGLFLAYCFLVTAPEFAFPAMAICIGVRYLVFRTLYGLRTYWILGGMVAMAGVVSAMEVLTLPLNLALMVGAIEVILALVILLARKTPTPSAA